MAFPNDYLNDFTNVILAAESQDYAAFRVYKHYVVDEADHYRMVMYFVSREEAAEGTEIIRDTTDTDKVTFRVYSRDRILLMDWSTDNAGANLTDGNMIASGISGNWGILSEPAGDKKTDIEDAITLYLNWLQYEPA
jgi:hypothetical protein